MGQDAGVWRGLCTRQEIGLKYSNGKPECFTSAVGKTGHVSFASLLQSDGTPYGGSIESQTMPDHAFGMPSSWDSRDKPPRRGIVKPNIKEFNV